MELTRYVDSLQQQLAVAAAAGGPEAEAVAERLAALDSAVRLTLQEAVVDAAAEITLALAPGSVDVRLAGRGLAFVVTPAASEPTPEVTSPVASSPASEEGDEGGTSRITFRPSDRLKGDIESAAEAQGLSVNAFLVRTLTLAVRQGSATPPPSAAMGGTGGTVTTPKGGQRLSGWAQ
ncbi:histidine kinase [Knoellia sp. CPCC 206453]|uniref:histidine kinase n=1 Tax=Knoellia pratensis TaxID=3404796 RepID=UPI00360E691E